MQHYDVIIMDVNMPDMNGIDAVTEIRKLEASAQHDRRPATIVGLTGNDDEQTCQLLRQAGADTVLVKPFRLHQLLTQIDHLEGSEPTTQRGPAAGDG